MKTEITKDRLSEFFYPTQNFCRRCLDNVIVDYAEIEINPDGIKKLENNLERQMETPDENEKWWKELTDPESDKYEHIIAYVHFDSGTDNFNKMFLEVYTAYSCDTELNVDNLTNEEEKRYIIDAALESLHRWRGTDKIMNGYGLY